MKTYQFAILVFALVFTAGTVSGNGQTCSPLTAGCLDPTFGTVGTQLIIQDGGYQHDVIVQSDGRIVSLVDNSNTGATLIRLNTDGTLDGTFAGDGIVETNWHYSSVLPRGYPYGLAVQNINGEERLVVAGSWTVPQGKNSAVTMLRVDRYLSNGAIDTSFGSGGTGTVLINKPYALAVAIQPTDNKIITVGDGQAVVRLNENGTIDTAFGPNGDGTTGAGQAGWSIKGLSDGSIIIGGSYSQNGSAVMCVTKLNANGSVFTSFGANGRAIANFYGRGSFGRAFRVDVDPFGNVIAGGIARPKNAAINENNFAAARFTSTGQLDTSFNGTGMVTYDFAGLNDNGRSIVAQLDGKLILTGAAQLSTADTADFALLRLNFDGTVDTTFGMNGRVTTNIDREDYSNSSRLWLDSSCACEKIILAGISHTDPSFARYMTQ
ncbi:MAG: hypothetical protein ABJB61_07370 [bacterium]